MDSLVTATNGTVEVARRKSARVNLGWEIDVTPQSTSMVTLTVEDGLPLPDGRTLLGGAQATVPGPTPQAATVVGTWQRWSGTVPATGLARRRHRITGCG